MTYEEALSFIHGIRTPSPKPGLRRIARLLELMDKPQDKLRFVHVAGTNGKGSTSTYISYILKEAGFRVGLNISPYVLDFRERIQVNNEMISKADLAEIIAYVKSCWDIVDAEGDTPSEFEVIVAVALEYFVRQRCDVVVLEVGLGGRLDATNVISSVLVSVITSISFDHTQILGDTIEKIAFEKAGIIKPSGVVVCYPNQNPAAVAVIKARCEELNSCFLLPESPKVLCTGLEGSVLQVHGMELTVPLMGEHQIHNAMTAITACRVLNERGLTIPPEAIVRGIEETRFPSRIEVVSQQPLILVDGAHNVSGVQMLRDALSMAAGRRIVCLTGMMKDKDIDGFLQVITPLCDGLVATALPEWPRFEPAMELAEKAKKYFPKAVAEPDPDAALEKALSFLESPEDVLVVCGSLYLASYYRPILLERFGMGSGSC